MQFVWLGMRGVILRKVQCEGEGVDRILLIKQRWILPSGRFVSCDTAGAKECVELNEKHTMLLPLLPMLEPAHRGSRDLSMPFIDLPSDRSIDRCELFPHI
jgi:hypothetical protein